MSLLDIWRASRDLIQTVFPPSYDQVLNSYQALSRKATVWANRQQKEFNNESFDDLLDWIGDTLTVMTIGSENVVMGEGKIQNFLTGIDQTISIKRVDPYGPYVDLFGEDHLYPEPEFWTIQKTVQNGQTVYQCQRSIEDFDRAEFSRLEEMLKELHEERIYTYPSTPPTPPGQ